MTYWNAHECFLKQHSSVNHKQSDALMSCLDLCSCLSEFSLRYTRASSQPFMKVKLGKRLCKVWKGKKFWEENRPKEKRTYEIITFSMRIYRWVSSWWGLISCFNFFRIFGSSTVTLFGLSYFRQPALNPKISRIIQKKKISKNIIPADRGQLSWYR